LTMGQPTSGNASGFRIQMSSHEAVSTAVTSPAIVAAVLVSDFVPRNVLINETTLNNFTLLVVGSNFPAESCNVSLCSNANCGLSVDLPSMIWYLNAANFEASPSLNWPDLSGFGNSATFHNQHTNWGDDFHNYPIHSASTSRTPYYDFNPDPMHLRQVVCSGKAFELGSGSDAAFSVGIWFSTRIASGLTIVGLQGSTNDWRGCTDNVDRYDLKFLVGYDGRLYFGATCSMLVTPFSVADGVWRYAVIAYSKSIMKLYVNGVLISSTTGYGSCGAFNPLFNGVWVVAGIRTTGWGGNFHGYGGYWPGKLGFVHIHNITLNQTQVEDSWKNIQEQVKQVSSCSRISSTVVQITVDSTVQRQKRVRL